MTEQSPHLPVQGHRLPKLMKASVEKELFLEKHEDTCKMLLTWF